jgi:hypothetical protein
MSSLKAFTLMLLLVAPAYADDRDCMQKALRSLCRAGWFYGASCEPPSRLARDYNSLTWGSTGEDGPTTVEKARIILRQAKKEARDKREFRAAIECLRELTK